MHRILLHVNLHNLIVVKQTLGTKDLENLANVDSFKVNQFIAS